MGLPEEEGGPAEEDYTEERADASRARLPILLLIDGEVAAVVVEGLRGARERVQHEIVHDDRDRK